MLKTLCEVVLQHYSGDITCDSREVVSGCIFIANTKNLQFLEHAINNGASCIFIPSEKVNFTDLGNKFSYFKIWDNANILSNTPPTSSNVFVIYDNYSSTLLHLLSQRYHSAPKNIAAVTGTNGKTSVAYFVYQLCNFMNIKAVSIGTVGIHSNTSGTNLKKVNLLTTASIWNLYRMIHESFIDGAQVLIMEASSHGIVQRRIQNINFNVAAFTNLSRDHLDYHQSYSSYFAAKKMLFSDHLSPSSTAVINSDISEFNILNSICGKNEVSVIDYGYSANVVRLLEIETLPNNVRSVKFLYCNKAYRFNTVIIGDFLIMNLLCSIGILLGFGFDIEVIMPHLTNVRNAPGRMDELIYHNKGTNIYIDYAHTPHALQSAILALRPLCDGRIIIVFGCGGDRDTGKRSEMGEIAALNADIVIVTDDNPRLESPKNIRANIIAGIKRAHRKSSKNAKLITSVSFGEIVSDNCIEIGSRKNAIEQAICMKNDNDVVLIAGRGHETWCVVGDKKIYFSDHDAAMEYLKSCMK